MTKVINREYVELGVDLLEPHPDNFNVGDKQAIAESIDVNGFYGAVYAREMPDGKYQILAGEHRWREAKGQGLARVPVIVLDVEDDAAALRIMAADNQTNRRGSNDMAKARSVLESLPDLNGTGFVMMDLQAYEESREAEERASAPPPEEKPAGEPPESKPSTFAREYGALVICADEAEQEATYNQLVDMFDVSRIKIVSV